MLSFFLSITVVKSELPFKQHQQQRQENGSPPSHRQIRFEIPRHDINTLSQRKAADRDLNSDIV